MAQPMRRRDSKQFEAMQASKCSTYMTMKTELRVAIMRSLVEALCKKHATKQATLKDKRWTKLG